MMELIKHPEIVLGGVIAFGLVLHTLTKPRKSRTPSQEVRVRLIVEQSSDRHIAQYVMLEE
jgi:hypothetical protein